MSLIGRAASAFLEKRITPPGTPWGDATPLSNTMIGTSAAGVRVTERSAMGIAAVWACVGVLADGVATLPMRQYKGDPLAVKVASLVDPSPIVSQPWAEWSLTDFLTAGQVSLAVRGNFFGRIVERDRRMYATQIQPLDPDWMTVKRNSSTGVVEYRINTRAGGSELIRPDDVVHVKNLIRPGALVGMNPIEELRVTLGLARAAEEYGASFFANSAVPLGVLETEEDLTPEATLRLARAWIQAHQGINKALLPAVLTGGVKFHETAFNFEDMQFIESRQLSNHDIAMIFRVPPHMISNVDRSTSWGSGIEQQMLGFVRFTLTGYLKRWQDALSALLPPGQFVQFDLRQLLRPDSVQRSAVIVNLRNAGVISGNEARDIYEDLPPAPGLDTYLVPLNMGDAGTPIGVPQPGGSK